MLRDGDLRGQRTGLNPLATPTVFTIFMPEQTKCTLARFNLMSTNALCDLESCATNDYQLATVTETLPSYHPPKQNIIA